MPDDPIGQDALHVDAAGPGRPLALPELLEVGAEEAVELADVADLGPAGVGAQDPLRVGDHRHDLLPDQLGLAEDVDRVADRLAHLADAVGAEDRGRLGEDRLRLGERLAVAAVEGAHDLAGELEVGGLVLADRHERRLVDDDVGGLQDRVRQQPVVDVVGLGLALLLVGRRALQPADRRHRGQQPGELGVLGAMALDEERAVLGIEAEGEQRRGHLAGARAQDVGIVGGGQGVVVDDAVDRLVLVLQAHVVADRAEVVAEVDDAGRLDAAERAKRGRGRAGGRDRGRARHRARVYPSVIGRRIAGLGYHARRWPGRPFVDRSVNRPLRVAVLGAGTVGREVVPGLLEGRSPRLDPEAGAFELVGVAARDLVRAAASGVPAHLLTDAPAHLVAGPTDLIVELMGGEEPARTLIAAALTAGKAVVTANKYVIAASRAGARGDRPPDPRAVPVRGGGHGRHADPAPARGRPGRNDGQRRSRHRQRHDEPHPHRDGDPMGMGYAEALSDAQEAGYAEADPTGDVEGGDAADKLVVLARLAFGVWLDRASVPVQRHGGRPGITGVTAGDLARAHRDGYAIRLLASARRRPLDGRMEAAVLTTAVPEASALGQTNGVRNRIEIEAESTRPARRRGAGRRWRGDRGRGAGRPARGAARRRQHVGRPARGSAGADVGPPPQGARVLPGTVRRPLHARGLTGGPRDPAILGRGCRSLPAVPADHRRDAAR